MHISFLEGLEISFFAIIFVFLMLYVISIVISLISFILDKAKKSEKIEIRHAKKSDSEDDEIVAVITAALQKDINGDMFVINKISDDKKILWSNNSKIESQN